MKKNHLLALALGAGLIATAGNAPAAIVSIDTGKLLPDSVGQAFSFDGTSLSYPAIVGECFRIQPNPDEFGPGYATDLMSWNTDNYHITAAPINFNASVMGADPQTGQLPRLTGPEDNVYYGLSYMVSAGVYNYGWLQISYNTDGSALKSVAFNTTPGEDIFAGQITAVPEPINVALGVFGAVFTGVAVVRRRRARKLSVAPSQ